MRDGPRRRRQQTYRCRAHRRAGVPAELALLAVLALLAGACGSDEPVQEPVPLPDALAIEYPIALWDRQVQGETEVMIHVDETGAVDSALVSQTSGHAEFDSAAVAGARRLRFTPGRRGERRIAMWTRIPIRFAQDSTATIGAARASGVRDD